MLGGSKSQGWIYTNPKFRPAESLLPIFFPSSTFNLYLWRNYIVFRVFLRAQNMNELQESDTIKFIQLLPKIKIITQESWRQVSPERDNLPIEPDTRCLNPRLSFLSITFGWAPPMQVCLPDQCLSSRLSVLLLPMIPSPQLHILSFVN